LGYLPEERGLYKRMKVRDLLTFYASLKGVADIRSALQRWLKQLDAESFANKRVDALSKGMAQKIQFITAVIGAPELLILDEPFSGLDPVNMEVLRDAVLQLRDSGTTVIFSTHDMEVAQQLCDSVFMIFRGDKVLDGTLEEIQRSYPCNEVQVQLSGELPSDLPGVSHIERNGSGYVLRLQEQASSEQLLAAVAPLGVQHFEVRRPTLRDIFVQIAKPAPEEMQ
jgi:ABC-2 type transport system ATP-binding protein